MKAEANPFLNENDEYFCNRTKWRARLAKEKTEALDIAGYDSDDNFAFIVGYTSGGFPYGLTHEEYEYIELDYNDQLDKKNTTA